MKINNKMVFYIYVAVLFILTYLLTGRLIKGIKTQEFDFLKIGVNALLLIYVIVQVVRLGNKENNKNE
jgi:surface polysaccharide O-acyltransferase-like enzyme